jgi:hypothetical protein
MISFFEKCPICEAEEEIKIDNDKIAKNTMFANKITVINKVSKNKFECEINIHCKNCRHDFKVIENVTFC